MRALAFCFVLVASTAHAGEVYKCVKGKQVSFQSEPCASDQEVKRIVPFVPDAEEPAWQRRQRTEQEMAERYARERASQASVITLPPSPDGCSLAKAHREAVLNAVGLKRTYDLLSELDRQVREACD